MFEEYKKELADICQLLYERRLVFGADGNVSMRMPDGYHILLTPSKMNKGRVTPDHILILNMQGEVVEGEGKPSKEFPMHRAVYEARGDIGAVIHTHPVYATAFAIAGHTIPDNYTIESTMFLKKTVLTDYATPGTEGMADVIRPYLTDTEVFLLKNHGAITCGKNLIEAFNKMECLESTAKAVVMSKLIGEPVPISESNMEQLRRR
ncbi:MAG: class II aldolase/adducin family protein [Lachnospiraceae bacterium]|nr:class II aldolase/adducin family protein [Lachnospiraceae bacterium]